MRVIKRYSNRRLYDTVTSKTITHRELAALVRRGEELRVVDNTTGRDITAEVLGRLMLTESAGWTDNQDAKDLFARIIQIGGESMSILKNTVLASIGAFYVTKEKAEQIVDELIKRGELNKSDRKQAVMELVDKAEKSTAKVYEKVSGEAGKYQKEISKLTDQLKQYKLVKREDIQNLEAKVDKLNKLVAQLEKKLGEKQQ